MNSPRDKPPPKSEDDFSDLILEIGFGGEPEPASKQPPVGAAQGAPRAASTRASAPPPPPEAFADDDAWEPGDLPRSPERSSQAVARDSQRPTRAAPMDPTTGKPQGPLAAPRAPRIPALDPQAEFAFGLEPDPHARAGGVPIAPLVLSDDDDDDDDDDDVPTMAHSMSSLHPEIMAEESEGPDLSIEQGTSEIDGDAYSLVRKASLVPVAMAPPDPRRDLSERFALGDFSGALLVAEALVAEGRADAEVERVAQDCRVKLEQMYIGRLGALTQVPQVAVPRSELKWLSLDHRAGFLLSLVDGASSVEEIMDVAGMPTLEVLRTLYELLGQRVIQFRQPGGARR